MTNPIKLGIPESDGQVSLQFTKGGARRGAGRKGFGETRKVSLTLEKEVWLLFEQICAERQCSKSELLRDLVHAGLQTTLPGDSEGGG